MTYNTAKDNGGDGMEAVCPVTVLHNTASSNGGENFDLLEVGDGPCVEKDNASPLPPPP